MEKKLIEWEVRESGRMVNWKVCLSDDKMITAEQSSGFPNCQASSHLHLAGLLDEIKSKRGKEDLIEEWVDIPSEGISIKERKNFKNGRMEIAGIIENIKSKHMESLKNLFHKTIKKGEDY